MNFIKIICNSFEERDFIHKQRRNIMENKEMYTKQEVVEMLKDMQRETGECVGFFVGQVSQLWVIKDLIEKRLNDMGETGVEVRVSK